MDLKAGPPASSPNGWFPSRGALLLLLLGGLAVSLALDSCTLAIHSFVTQHRWLDNLFNPLRDFGGTPAQVIVLAMALALNRRRWRWVLIAALALLAASVAVTVIKILVGRGRPEIHAGLFSFQPWGGVFDDKYSSFPSGHSASAFALAVVLAHVHPSGRWGFFLIAAGCGVARVVEARHFPSDVYTGALIGFAAGQWMVARGGKWCGPPLTGS